MGYREGMVIRNMPLPERFWMLCSILIFLTSVVIGLALENQFHLWRHIKLLANLNNEVEVQRDAKATLRDNHFVNPKEVRCPTKFGTMVVLIIGQSNAANYAEPRHRGPENVTVFYNGKCYESSDPLLGSTGDRGSIWPRFANLILASGRYQYVMLVPAAVGGSSMEAWAPGGIYYDRITVRLQGLRTIGMQPTHILVAQGEADSKSKDGRRYFENAVRLLNALQLTGARVFFATTSKCMGRINPAIRSAQEKARIETHTASGPDADLVSDDQRINKCHYSPFASEFMAESWARTVLNN